MAKSILADAPFEQTTFGYVSPGGTGTDEYGQPIDLPGIPGSLLASFAPFKRDQVRFVEGADPNVIEGRGELLDPTDFPTFITLGSDLTCTYAGRSWTAKLTSIIPNDLPTVSLGAYFEATLTPASAS